MSDKNNLPIRGSSRNVVALAPNASLLARGLLSVQQDHRYRQARAVVDKYLYKDGWEEINWTIKQSAELFEAFQTLRRLADEKYGKAYYPLALLYKLKYR